jgi:ribonuclease T1
MKKSFLCIVFAWLPAIGTLTAGSAIMASYGAPSSPAGQQVSGYRSQQSAFPELPVIHVNRLPPEARRVLQLIHSGGPFPYPKDGAVFSNRERLLPAKPRGHYREYTVKTPGSRDRGARRIISGKNGGFYYTDDHYNSFKRIVE